MKNSSPTICDFCNHKFNEYNEEGADFYFDEGFRRAWLDHDIGQDPDWHRDLFDVPECYRNDYHNGYDNGFREYDEKDDSRLAEVNTDEPQF